MKGTFSRDEEHVKSFRKSEDDSEFFCGRWEGLISEQELRNKDRFIILDSRDTAKFNSN